MRCHILSLLIQLFQLCCHMIVRPVEHTLTDAHTCVDQRTVSTKTVEYFQSFSGRLADCFLIVISVVSY